MENLILLAEEKLAAMGIEFDENIELELNYYVNLASVELCGLLGVKSVPNGTEYLLSEMIVGMYLRDILISEDRTVSYASSIKQGEVTIDYEDGKSLWDIVNEMAKPSEYKLSAYRCIRW